MKGKRCSTEEKVRSLQEVDAGKSIVDNCREKNISDVTYHFWRKQFGHMDLNEAKRLKDFERENTALKKMLADAKRVLEYALEKNYKPGAQESDHGTVRQRRAVLRACGLQDPGPIQDRIQVPERAAKRSPKGDRGANACPDSGEPAVRLSPYRGAIAPRGMGNRQATGAEA